MKARRQDEAAVIGAYRIVHVSTGRVSGMFLVEPPAIPRDREANRWSLFSVDVTIYADDERTWGRTFSYKDIWGDVLVHPGSGPHEAHISLHMTPQDRRGEVEDAMVDVQHALTLAATAYLAHQQPTATVSAEQAWSEGFDQGFSEGVMRGMETNGETDVVDGIRYDPDWQPQTNPYAKADTQ